jgi:hypothetical protein
MSSASLSMSRSGSIRPSAVFVRFVAAVAFVLVLSISVLPAGQETETNPAAWSREEKEDFLRTAEIVRSEIIPGGTTRSSRATLRNGRGTHDAHIQSIDVAATKFEGVAGQWEINFRDTYKFNLAAYIMDRILGMDMIPPTVERKVGKRPAAVTWWIDDVLMDEKERLRRQEKPPIPERTRWNRQIHIVRVFDQLIANKDRNFGNIVITRGWNVWIIDHTRAFRAYKELFRPDDLVRCDRALLEGMRALDRKTLVERIGMYLTDMEIDGLLARRDRIVKLFDDKAAGEGKDVVLFDYLVERRKGPATTPDPPNP